MRILRVLSLMILSAVVAEFLLGDQYLFGLAPAGQQVGQLVIFTAFYGGSAVLIRELARRRGAGWRAVALLALGFALLEEGLVTQSLFNPDYAGAHLLAYGFVRPLGIAVPWTLFVLTLHVVWSISSPIAVVEALWRSQEPWLGRVGLVVVAVLAVLGGVAITAFTLMSGPFVAHPAQLVVALLLALICVFFALRQPRRAGRDQGRLLVGLVGGVALTSAFQVGRQYLPRAVPPWATSLVLAALLAVAVLVCLRTTLNVLGLALGALVTYGWIGLTQARSAGSAGVIEQIVIIVLVAAVAVFASIRSRRPASRAGQVAEPSASVEARG
jgi:hypothetical protein